jgi:hypothetical protein
MMVWSFIQAIVGSPCVVNIAVSSAKVKDVVLPDVGRSLVQMSYRTGNKTLPCGTLVSIFLKVVVSSLNFT